MEDSELEESEHDLPCTPKKDKLRYIDDDDLISSDDASPNKPKNYNQLNPKAEFIYKLLKSAKPKSEDIWKDVAVPEGINLIDIDTLDLDLYSVSQHKMAKSSKKRKREENSSGDEERLLHKQKTARHSHAVVKHLKYSVVHDMSPSDSDGSLRSKSAKLNNLNEKIDSNSVKSQSECGSSSEQEKTILGNRSNKSFNKSVSQNEAFTNGHSDSEDTSYRPSAGINSDCDYKQIKSRNKNRSTHNNSVEELNYKSSDTNSVKEKFYQHSFTEKDREVISKYSFLLSDKLAEKNNIWILQCPSNIDCSGLENQYLDLGSSCQLNIGGRSFEAYSYRDSGSRSATLAVPSRENHLQLCRIPITGNIIVEESIGCENNTSFQISEPSQSVAFPENLRTRHPLLGVDYEKQPKTLPKIERVFKKKKHSQTYDESNEDALTEITSSSMDHSKKKKKKQHRSNKDMDISVTESEILSSSVEYSKKKKKLHKSRDKIPELELNTSGSMEYVKKKKKNKHKESENAESSLTEISLEEYTPVDPLSEDKSKRKKKKKHLDDTSFS